MNPSAILAALTLSATAFAAAGAESISVVEPYVRLTPPGSRATAAYMVVKNGSEANLAIVKADSPAAKLVELHTHLNDGGVMRMRQVKEIPLPAKGEAVLAPGGYHVMLIDLKAPLKEGEKIPISLGFSDGSTKTFEAPVKKPQAQMHAH
ncbi:MAG: copper chaperone PCu(A)C [Rhodocyclaceae bacterium]|nr:copper chaperone PCu(A)C [Rhodocyclaceae bacterium]